MWHPPFLSERSTIKQVELLCSLLLFISIIGWESRKQRFIYMVCTSLIPSRPSGRKPSMIICGSLWQPKKTQAVWTWEYLTVTIWVCRVSLQFSWNLFNPVWWWLKAWCQLLGFFSVWLKQKVFSEAGTEFPRWSREATVSQRTDKKTSSSWENSSSNMMAARNRMQLECWLSQCMYFLEAGEQHQKKRRGGGGAADPLRGLNSKSGMYNWWISRISLNLVRSIPAVFTTFQDCQVDFLALHVIKLRSSRYRLFMFVDFLLLAERIRSDVL